MCAHLEILVHALKFYHLTVPNSKTRCAGKIPFISPEEYQGRSRQQQKRPHHLEMEFHHTTLTGHTGLCQAPQHLAALPCSLCFADSQVRTGLTKPVLPE